MDEDLVSRIARQTEEKEAAMKRELRQRRLTLLLGSIGFAVLFLVAGGVIYGNRERIADFFSTDTDFNVTPKSWSGGGGAGSGSGTGDHGVVDDMMYAQIGLRMDKFMLEDRVGTPDEIRLGVGFEEHSGIDVWVYRGANGATIEVGMFGVVVGKRILYGTDDYHEGGAIGEQVTNLSSPLSTGNTRETTFYELSDDSDSAAEVAESPKAPSQGDDQVQKSAEADSGMTGGGLMTENPQRLAAGATETEPEKPLGLSGSQQIGAAQSGAAEDNATDEAADAGEVLSVCQGEIEAFVVPEAVDSILITPPMSTMRRHGIAANETQVQALQHTDDVVLAEGAYHLVKIPNLGKLRIEWTGHAEEGPGAATLWCWDGERFQQNSFGQVNSNETHSVEVVRPRSEQYVFAMVNCTTGRIFTDSIVCRILKADVPTTHGSKTGELSEPDTPFRTWSDKTGEHHIEARFAGFGGGIVKLKKKDGTTVELPIENLSDEDQKWIRSRGKR